ncbi:MAG TPA: polysaccharide lyase family protein [Ktedonobacteraceae bacterium]|nr:polysaccharide lyase family protein [Ktedonobacteraceae bacterium]
MTIYRRRLVLLSGTVLIVLALGLLTAVPSMRMKARAAAAASPVSLQVSGMDATISNGIFTIKFNSSGTGYSLVWNGQELIGPAKGFYSSVNGTEDFSPTQLEVVTNTSSMVDIAYISSWGALHYVVMSGVSGLYSYFIASGIGTVGEYRTLYRVDGNIFRTGYNGVESAIPFPTLSQIQAATVLQDSTYQLTNGTIYTKYDASTYVDQQDTLHGVYGGGYGVWMISPSHEYVNGGPLKQELTVHVDSSTGDAVVLNMLVGSHFGNPNVSIPSGKIFGPWFVYFNNGSISDAQAQAAAQDAQWPYTWLSNSAYPLSRTTVTGTLRLADGRPAAGAQVTLAQPGGDVYAQGSGYIFTAQADANGNFRIPYVRAGNYSLYAWANGGSIGDITDQYELDNINVSGSTQNLGTLTWTPTEYSNLLWQIGTADRKADEFRLGNVPRQYGLWNQVPANLTYTIGSSTPANNWYYAQTQVGTWTVNFNLSQTYSGTAHLTVALAGATRTADVTVAVNGTTIGSYPSFANDQAIYRSANQSGYYHLIPLSFAASLLKAGSNSITFDMTSVSSGGGVMYDTIKLETGSLVTGSGGGTPTPTPTSAPTPSPTPIPATPTPTPGSTSSCNVSYSVSSQWPGGFTGNIIITNTGSTTLNGWTLQFTFSGGQQVTQGWNGTFSQQGSQVTVQSLSYNSSLSPGGSTSVGFNGTWTSSNPSPTSFTLNGIACSTS